MLRNEPQLLMQVGEHAYQADLHSSQQVRNHLVELDLIEAALISVPNPPAELAWSQACLGSQVIVHAGGVAGPISKCPPASAALAARVLSRASLDSLLTRDPEPSPPRLGALFRQCSAARPA